MKLGSGVGLAAKQMPPQEQQMAKVSGLTFGGASLTFNGEPVTFNGG